MATRKPHDPNGRHIRVYCSLLDSAAWRVLGWSARALFIDLRAKLNGTNNGNISATLSDMKHRGWKHPGTLAGALYELQALGFLIQTRGGGVERGSKVCALYAFTDLDVFDFPKLNVKAMKASHAYRAFSTNAEATAAKREGVAQFRAVARARHEKARAKARAQKK